MKENNSSKGMSSSLIRLRERNMAHNKKNKIKQLSPEELKQIVEQGRAREAVARYKQV